jgi:hypothetical protein
MDITFIKENYLNIIVFIVLFLGFLVLIKVKDWNFNPYDKSPQLIQEVVMETLENMKMDENQALEELKLNPASSFCESYVNDSSSHDLEGACQKMTKNNCLKTSCCVYYGNKCAAGSQDGPTYKSNSDGEPFDIDYYYYQKKCYGNCPN